MERVSQPVFAIYGTQDKAVPVVQSSRGLAAALERGGNRAYTIRFFAGASHGLRVGDGEFAPGYLQTMVGWIKGLPATAQPPSGRQIAGATPLQRYVADETPTPPSYATVPALAVGFGLAGIGFLAGPIAALVTRQRGAGLEGDAGEWLPIRRLLRWLTVSGISTHLLFNLVLAGSIALALTQAGSPPIVNGGWLVVRLAALVTVVLAVASVDVAASAARNGWKPTGVQAVSMVGSYGATGILLLVAACWGLFAFRW